MHNGKVKKIVFEAGTLKGAETIFKVCDVDTKGVMLNDMRKLLAMHEDFKIGSIFVSF